MSRLELTRETTDYPCDAIEEAQTWWEGVDLLEREKELVGRGNAIPLFKLPLDP